MLGGDWYGSAVNVAARLAGEASANEALVSWATRSAACDDLKWSLKHRCEIVLRGIERPIAVWSLRPSTPDSEAALANQRVA
jgi:class 3 adenylate cyclase